MVAIMAIVLVSSLALAGEPQSSAGVVTDPAEQITLLEPYRSDILRELSSTSSEVLAEGLRGELEYIEVRIAKACAQLKSQPSVCSTVAGS